MTDAQKIIREIGSLIWSMFPEDAHSIEFSGCYYPTHHQAGPIWYDQQRARLGPKHYTPELLGLCDEISRLVLKLRKSAPFADDPFTHIRVSMTQDQKLDLEVAHIPEWDSWPGLRMRRVSDLSRSELSDCHISEGDWLKCCERRGSEKDIA